MNKALIVVDMQNDFGEKGTLPVKGGISLAKSIYDYLVNNSNQYKVVVATKDSHQAGNNGGHFSDTPNFNEDWPVHCREYTWGWLFINPLGPNMFDEIVHKGRGIPAYSGFQGVCKNSKLTLHEYLARHEITSVDVCGLATDYCVFQTAADALRLGFDTTVLSDLTEAVGEKETTLKNLKFGKFVHIKEALTTE